MTRENAIAYAQGTANKTAKIFLLSMIHHMVKQSPQAFFVPTL